MKDTSPRWPLFASLIAYFILTTALIIKVPWGASPDEAAHALYVQHLAELGTLPVFKPLPPDLNAGYEFHQPPLYYAICAPFWKLLGAGVQNYACRGINMLACLATIWVIWLAARLAFPSNWRIAAYATALAALLPMNQAVGAGVNNDGLAGLFCALLFLWMARLWKNGVTWRDVWQLGVLSGLGLLTKNTTVTVIAVSFAYLVVTSGKSSDEKSPRPVMALAGALGITLLLAGPVWLRNQNLYGDVLAQKIFKEAFIGVPFGNISPMVYLQKLVFVSFCTFWGVYGGPNTLIDVTRLFRGGPTLPHPWLYLPMLLCGLAPVVSVLGWRILKAQGELDDSPLMIRSGWVCGAICVGLAWLMFAVQYFAGGQARYVHPALLPICIFLGAGWVGFWERRSTIRVASIVFGFVLLSFTLLNVLHWKTLV